MISSSVYISHFYITSVPFFHLIHDPGGEFSWRFQLCSGRPDLPGVHSQHSVVSRAARYHIWWRAQELLSQVRKKSAPLMPNYTEKLVPQSTL